MAVLDNLRLIYYMLMLFFFTAIAYIGFLVPLYPLYLIWPDLNLFFDKIVTKYHNNLMAVIALSSGFEITDYGDDVTDLGNKKALVMANHQSHADHFPILATFSTKTDANANPIWLIYKFLALRWSPLGIGWAYHGNYFVETGKREKEIEKLKRHLVDYYWKNSMGWIFLYPEGAILPKYKLKSQAFAAKNGHPHLECLSLPRTTAIQAILESNLENKVSGDAIEYIIDVTVGYPQGIAPDIIEMFKGLKPNVKTGMFYRIFKVSDLISLSDHDIRKWLFDRWIEKEKLLEFYHANNSFPGEGRKVQFDVLEMITVQIVWILASVVIGGLWLGLLGFVL